jgi:hypothetical protein
MALLILLSWQVSSGQNLVPNPGFEEFLKVSAGQSAIENAPPWFNTNKKQNTALFGTPDHLFKAPTGQGSYRNEAVFAPYQGESAAGVITFMQRVYNYREYLSIRLLKPMQIGNIYEVSCYISSGNQMAFGAIGTNGFGLLLTDSPPEQQQYEPLYEKPQFMLDKIFFNTNWVKISFPIKADKAYEYLTIGNFLKDSEIRKRYFFFDVDPQAYIFIDEVSVVETDDLYARNLEPVFQTTTEERVYEPATYVEGRQVNVQSTFKAESERIVVQIWDRKEVDGDVVSLKFNNRWVLKEYSLRKKKQKIVLYYEKGMDNQLIFYAHTLGTQPPNTAAILVTSGKNKRYFDIRSDLNYSGAIQIVWPEQ